MSINRREAIKRSAITMGGLALFPGALAMLKGCTPVSINDYVDGSRVIDEDLVKINSVSELRNKQGEAGEVVHLKGYYGADDGGGTEVYWDHESTEDDDGGMVFRVEGISKGRWKRPDIGFINVKWFGARGDGKFRSGSDNDVEFIDKALQWVIGKDEKRVYIPEGVYVIKVGIRTKITSNLNGLELFGDGHNSEIRMPDNPNDILINESQHLWMLRGASTNHDKIPLRDIYIHDLKFNGNRSNNGAEHQKGDLGSGGGYGIRLFGSNGGGSGSTFPLGEDSFNIKIENCWTGNCATTGCSVSTSDTKIINHYSTLTHLHGISTSHCKNVHIEKYTAYRCGDGRGYAFDFSEGSVESSINDFEAIECYNGMKCSINANGATITNGIFKGIEYRAVDQSGFPHPDHYLKIENVEIDGTGGTSVRINSAASVDINNLIIKNGLNNAGAFSNNPNNEIFHLGRYGSWGYLQNFNAHNLTIENSKAPVGIRLGSVEATFTNFKMSGDYDIGINAYDCIKNGKINGTYIRDCNIGLSADGSSSWEVEDVEFTGNTAIKANSGTVIDTSNSDFNGVLLNHEGSGTVNYQ